MGKLTNYERQYIKILKNIYQNGYADGVNERTGVSTKRLPNQVISVDLEEEFPILKSKNVRGKSALQEIEWIWKQQSNNIHDLKPHIWDAWADENGSIGTAYGAQIAIPVNTYLDFPKKSKEAFRSYQNQAEYILEYLRENPNGRHAVATIWNPQELARMGFIPCVHTTSWNLDGGRLNVLVDQRSGDFPIGVPFNTTQYAMLCLQFARDLGVKPGNLTHVIADAHIYDRQMEGVGLQLRYYEILEYLEDDNFEGAQRLIDCIHIEDYPNEKIAKDLLLEKGILAIESKPKFVFDTDETGFFKYDFNNCHIEGYEHMGNIDFGEVVV
jgi:thymidylate synthase